MISAGKIQPNMARTIPQRTNSLMTDKQGLNKI
jgi:hypothetical protein